MNSWGRGRGLYKSYAKVEFTEPLFEFRHVVNGDLLGNWYFVRVLPYNSFYLPTN